jgi:hypothetical protein
METRSQRPLADRLVRICLPLLLVWSFLLRAWVATLELTARRFPDEVFGRVNLRALLLHGQIRPAGTSYPSLSYLPQAVLLSLSEGLHRMTGQEVFRIFDPAENLTATGYLLCRLLQVVFGTLSLYLTFRIGKRLFSAPVGLGGALLLSVVEWHIRQSVIFKPDILLLLMSLLAFLWSLDAAEKPGWRRYVLAGVGIGLALSSKYNAAPLAIPLFVATLARGPGRDRRRWAWLVLAGVAAAAVFLLLNPYVLIDPNSYTEEFGNTLRHYAKKGAARRASHGTLPLHAIQTLLSGSFHGPAVGILSLLGVAGLAVAVIRRPREGDPERRLGRAMALAYVAGYTLLYSFVTTNPSPHNWLVLTPYTSLCAAWAVAWSWEWLAARRPVLARPDVRAAAAVPAVLLLVLSAQRIAHGHALPATWEVAQNHLMGSLRPLAGRLVYYERERNRIVLRASEGKALAVGTPRLDQIPPRLLDRADAELLLEDRLAGEGSDFYRRRLAATAPRDVVRIRPSLFRIGGPSLVILVHPWRQVGRPVDLELPSPGSSRGQQVLRLPSLAPQELGSLGLALPKTWNEQGGVQAVFLGRKRLGLGRFKSATEAVVVTTRFDAVEARAPLHIRLVRPVASSGEEIRVRLYRWRR